MPCIRPRSSAYFPIAERPCRWGKACFQILLSGRGSVKRVIREVNAPSLRRFGDRPVVPEGAQCLLASISTNG